MLVLARHLCGCILLSSRCQMKLEHKTFKVWDLVWQKWVCCPHGVVVGPLQTPSGKAIEVNTVASSFHIEINPGDAGIHDRYVVQEVIKEIAQYNPLDKSFKGMIPLRTPVPYLYSQSRENAVCSRVAE
jgi:hypothetical protein